MRSFIRSQFLASFPHQSLASQGTNQSSSLFHRYTFKYRAGLRRIRKSLHKGLRFSLATATSRFFGAYASVFWSAGSSPFRASSLDVSAWLRERPEGRYCHRQSRPFNNSILSGLDPPVHFPREDLILPNLPVRTGRPDRLVSPRAFCPCEENFPRQCTTPIFPRSPIRVPFVRCCVPFLARQRKPALFPFYRAFLPCPSRISSVSAMQLPFFLSGPFSKTCDSPARGDQNFHPHQSPCFAALIRILSQGPVTP